MRDTVAKMPNHPAVKAYVRRPPARHRLITERRRPSVQSCRFKGNWNWSADIVATGAIVAMLALFILAVMGVI